jgi:hypothetical protein
MAEHDRGKTKLRLRTTREVCADAAALVVALSARLEAAEPLWRAVRAAANLPTRRRSKVARSAVTDVDALLHELRAQAAQRVDARAEVSLGGGPSAKAIYQADAADLYHLSVEELRGLLWWPNPRGCEKKYLVGRNPLIRYKELECGGRRGAGGAPPRRSRRPRRRTRLRARRDSPRARRARGCRALRAARGVQAVCAGAAGRRAGRVGRDGRGRLAAEVARLAAAVRGAAVAAGSCPDCGVLGKYHSAPCLPPVHRRY